jgi:hypothetical protein
MMCNTVFRLTSTWKPPPGTSLCSSASPLITPNAPPIGSASVGRLRRRLTQSRWRSGHGSRHLKCGCTPSSALALQQWRVTRFGFRPTNVCRFQSRVVAAGRPRTSPSASEFMELCRISGITVCSMSGMLLWVMVEHVVLTRARGWYVHRGCGSRSILYFAASRIDRSGFEIKTHSVCFAHLKAF